METLQVQKLLPKMYNLFELLVLLLVIPLAMILSFVSLSFSHAILSLCFVIILFYILTTIKDLPINHSFLSTDLSDYVYKTSKLTANEVILIKNWNQFQSIESLIAFLKSRAVVEISFLDLTLDQLTILANQVLENVRLMDLKIKSLDSSKEAIELDDFKFDDEDSQ